MILKPNHVPTCSVANGLARFFGAIISGALATFAFAPFSFSPAMLVSLVFLFLLLHNQTAKRAGWIGFAWGLGQFGTGVSWVYVVIDRFGGMPLFLSLFVISLLVLYLSLFPALFGHLSQRFKLTAAGRTFAMIPLLWILIDWMRGWLLTGFPWLWAGYSQIESPLNSLAPVFGVQGITFALVMIASSIVYLITQKRWVGIVPILSIAVVAGILHSIDWVKETGKQVKVAMIQGNIPQEIKWVPRYRWPTLHKFQDLTEANWDADIIIWPEAAVPAREDEIVPFLSALDEKARATQTAIVTGIMHRDEENNYYNSIIALGDLTATDNNEAYVYPSTAKYDKHHLLIFGEFVPLSDLLRPIAPLFNLPMSSFTPGEYKQANIPAKGYELAPAICYEIAFGEQVRDNVLPNSNFILTLSNDTWFGNSIGPHQHLEIAQMRALENARPVLRATNNGVTAAVNYDGQIITQIPQFETSVLRSDVPVVEGRTPYNRLGDTLLNVLLIFAGVGVYFSARRANSQEQ